MHLYVKRVKSGEPLFGGDACAPGRASPTCSASERGVGVSARRRISARR